MPEPKQKPTYYGSFFWISLVSFSVPLVVAWSAFSGVGPTTKPTPAPDVSGVDHNLWDYLLKAYVENGLVDYDGMKRDYLLQTYLKQLGSCDPTKLTEESDRLALHCNAYNAFVINGVITHKIDDSVLNYNNEDVGFFDLTEHVFAGETISLNHLEHEVIRPTFGEPRVHVALVCAARSCPAIRPEAYDGKRIEQQLFDQSCLFANNPKYLKYDSESNKIQLNPILDWYGDDWKNEGGYLLWLYELAEDEALKSALSKAVTGQIAVSWNEYDWSLNSQNSSGKSSHSGGGTVPGSGSIPNE